MKIALIASRLHTGGGLVVGQNIVESVCELCPHDEILIVVPDGTDYPVPDRKKLKVVHCPRQSALQQIWWDHTTLASTLSAFQPDWVWALGNYPVPGNWRQSVLIHDPHLMFDASWFRNETVKNKVKKGFGKFLLKRRLGTPQRFYCQTSAIRDRVSKQLGIDRDKIGFCPPGIEAPPPKESSAELNRAFEQTKNADLLLFYPARCYGHKNHKVILEAYRTYGRELADTACIWTIAKGQHPIAGVLLDQVEDAGLQDQIINVGPISTGGVAACFEKSDVLLMPTKLETYGIPFIEAMQQRVAIITSDYDFTRAVCGDAAMYVTDPDDPGLLRDAIVHLRDNPAARSKLADAGTAIANQLPSWLDSVSNVLAEEKILPTAASRV